MYTEKDYEIANTKETQAARKRVKLLVSLGDQAQKRLVEHCAANIPIDSYVPPHRMEFGLLAQGDGTWAKVGELTPDSPIVITYFQGPSVNPRERMTAYNIHQHALGQLCDLVGLPRAWMNKLNQSIDTSWKRVLLSHDLNTLYKNTVLLNARKKPAEFLHRRVGDELRAVLTQSYNRHLVSAAVLQPFLEVCQELGLQPAYASITDMKVGLQTYLPYAFEPIPGEFIALGAWWGNSDFGQGKLRISHTIMRVASGSTLLTEDSFSRVHLGSVVTDTDLRMDDNVAIKELEAVAAATQSAVRSAMEPQQVRKVLNAVTAAHEAKVPWLQLKEKFSKFLSQGELTDISKALDNGIEELPRAGLGADGQPLLSRWWAAAAVSHLADKQVDVARATELRLASGTFLEAS